MSMCWCVITYEFDLIQVIDPIYTGCKSMITKDSLVEDKEYAQFLKKKRKRDDRYDDNIVDL